MNSNDFKLENELNCILREFKKGDIITIEKAFDKIPHDKKMKLDEMRETIKIVFNQLILENKAELEYDHEGNWIDYETFIKECKKEPRCTNNTIKHLLNRVEKIKIK